MAVLFTDPIFLEHDTRAHPECAARLQAITARLEGSDVRQRFEVGSITPAERAQIERVHTPEHIAEIERFAAQGGGRIETDTVMSPRSFDVALRAAGAAVSAVDLVLGGEHRRAMCLIRPPGHHALPTHAMGFCLFNNVAIAAAHAVAAHELSRVLIVDFDVHHGNGTQDMFYENENVYFYSSHRSPFYPGTGDADETGTGAGLGTVFNLPCRFGISRSDFRDRFESTLHDAASRCKPELVLVSAGFDAHAADPVGSLGLETEDFGPLTEMIVGVADEYCDGKIVSLLEGGYNVNALAECVEQHLDVLVPQ